MRAKASSSKIDPRSPSRSEAKREMPAAKTTPPGLQHAPRLREGREAIDPIGEVVEGAEEEDGVGGAVSEREASRVAHPHARQPSGGPRVRSRPGLLDVERHGVHEVHVVPLLGEPEGVGSGRAAHVEHDAGRRSKVAGDELPCPRPLEGEVGLFEPALLATQGVVAQDLVGRAHLAHRARVWVSVQRMNHSWQVRSSFGSRMPWGWRGRTRRSVGTPTARSAL